MLEVDSKDDAQQLHGHRYFNASMGKYIVKVDQGNCYVSGNDGEVLTTTLGSCIAACIRDPIAGVGGMNHFMLPASDKKEWTASASIVSPELRYGNFAMEQLINSVLKRGGRRERLEIKVFGGGNVLNIASQVGSRNADFVEKYLLDEGLSVASQDLRGDNPRRIQYYPVSGRVQLMRLAGARAADVARTEQRRRPRVRPSETEGEIELFD